MGFGPGNDNTSRGTTAKAAQCIGRTHQHRVPDLLGRADSVADRVAAGAFGDLLATGFDDLQNQRGAVAKALGTLGNDDRQKVGKNMGNGKVGQNIQNCIKGNNYMEIWKTYQENLDSMNGGDSWIL